MPSSYFDMSLDEYSASWEKLVNTKRPEINDGEKQLITVVMDLDTDDFLTFTSTIKPMYKMFENTGPLFPVLRLRDDGVNVVYTESDDKRERDIRTIGKLGKFLRRIAFDGVTDEKIDKLVSAIRSKFISTTDTGVVKFAITAEDIKRVYMGGPTSCMDSKVWSTLDNYHPCMSYAYPLDRTEIVPDSGNSIAVAYLGDIDHASARAVADMGRKQYKTVYGGRRDTLISVLRELGYDEDCCFLKGQKLAFHRSHSGGIYLPYLDGCTDDVDIVDDQYLLVIDGGEHQANSAGVIGGPDRTYCSICGEWVDEDDTTYIERYDRVVCNGCLEEHYTYAVVEVRWSAGNALQVREYVNSDDVIFVDGEAYYEDSAHECGISRCDSCEDWHSNDDMLCLDNDDGFSSVIDDTGWSTEDFLCSSCYALAIEELKEARRKLEESVEVQVELCLL